MDGNVYTDFHDFFNEGSCWYKECKDHITTDLVEDCGEDEYGEWDNYCEGKELRKQRYYAQPGCANGACFIGTVIQDELVEECSYDCFEGKCIDEPQPVCGNDILEPSEECDDGNLINGDGCSSICEIEEPEPPVCYVDLDCGIDYCLGEPNYCLDNNVYQDFKIQPLQVVIPKC